MIGPNPTCSFPGRNEYDAVIVGSGPNGLSAAITLAREGWRTPVVEAADSIGGGMRTKELTKPGFLHDVCSAVHLTGIASPFFRSLKLEERHPLTPKGRVHVRLNHRIAGTNPRLLPREAETNGPQRAGHTVILNTWSSVLLRVDKHLVGPAGVWKPPGNAACLFPRGSGRVPRVW